ncbi:hypothetical protein V2J09_000893 [Rumex salicifolius]
MEILMLILIYKLPSIKDIATKVIACELNLVETPVSEVMTRNPVFVLSDTLAVEALQKMVKGKFRHLPVVENGEVIALLDIAKCLYDAIARMERASEKGKAIAAAVEGVEKSWGPSGSSTFIEALREQIFRPSLSNVISEHSKFITVSPSDTVLVAAKKFNEFKLSCAAVTVENKPRGILTIYKIFLLKETARCSTTKLVLILVLGFSKTFCYYVDILMRVIITDLPPESTLVEKGSCQIKACNGGRDFPIVKVMTPNPECVTGDTPIVDALHTMHDGKFLHLPVTDKGIACIYLHCEEISSNGVFVAKIGGVNNGAASSKIQNFWDTAMQLGPMATDEGEDTRSEFSMKPPSDGVETGKSFSYPLLPHTFAFKLEDRRGRVHRFISDTSSFTELLTCILQRVGDNIDRNNLPRILYEDEEHDFVVLASDSDLAAAVDHARAAGMKGLRLRLVYAAEKLDNDQTDAWAAAYSAVAAGAALVAGFGMLAYLKRNT